MKILEKNKTFKEVCIELDNRKIEFEKSGREGDSIKKVWSKFINRKNTFLTSK